MPRLSLCLYAIINSCRKVQVTSPFEGIGIGMSRGLRAYLLSPFSHLGIGKKKKQLETGDGNTIAHIIRKERYIRFLFLCTLYVTLYPYPNLLFFYFFHSVLKCIGDADVCNSS